MKVVVLPILGLSLGICSFLIGRDIPFQAQKELLEPLLGIAGIIFGVLGIWVGILYPEIISKAKDINSPTDANAVNKELGNLIFPLVVSLVLLIIIILLLYIAPILKSFRFSRDTVFIFRGVAFSVVSVVTFCWIYRILKLLALSGWLKGIISEICAKRLLKQGLSNGFKVKKDECDKK